ncbi:superoxide dismutase family protein [Maribacter polysiphoniae]|uniref:Cu-Zn family superoxide dismutase n=1 Tax=Maribacter polysiphoniae TaxID=429344 RepID=A0A316DZR9_9FLAO|nr:superoxide dismutase family protein [Maribacter polysiphoniae]MBD1261105.1 superoxide dismutase family protein [Maribacter polysiphoniae]PWK23654.1 Cu-Zn family superoxide dismutase [Maribacter polysiphoniae]
MKKLYFFALAFVLMAGFSCKETKKEATEKVVKDVVQEESVETISFTMEPKSDSTVKGEVTFTQEDDEVTMIANFSGLTPGKHAIHLHEKADCSSYDGKSTGGHWNPTHEPHGKWGAAEGYHKGDIGNFVANEEGNATLTFSTDQWCIGCDDQNRNIVGKAVIVHQGVDDFVSQPSGDAGARISCTGIIQ